MTFLKSKMGTANSVVEWTKEPGTASSAAEWAKGPGIISSLGGWGKGPGTVILVEGWERGAGSGASVGGLASKPIWPQRFVSSRIFGKRNVGACDLFLVYDTIQNWL